MSEVAATRPQRTTPMTLGGMQVLLAAWDPAARLVGDPEVAVQGMTLATSRTQPGDLYCALPGTRAHGATYLPQALAAGAVAVLTDEAGARLLQGSATPALVVTDVRAVLGLLAAELHAHPAESLTMLAVTGTQGKTTTTRLLERALSAASVPAAVIGTVGTRVLGEELKTALTTPEAPDLQALLAGMRERQVAVCAMEVSSHALVLGRVDGVRFDVSAFLNLGRDHLDFHADVEDYYRAKAELFTPARTRRAVINSEDEHGRRLALEAAALGVEVRTFALDPATGADWSAAEISSDAHGSTFTLLGPDDLRVEVRVPLAGRFNVANAVAALALAGEAGLDVALLARHFADGGGVPGRLEPVQAGQDFAVVVDYAHKPDAVEAALGTLRPLTEGRLIVVIGAGGDRDTGKRPVMGEIAARLADLVVVVVITDDNPRTEDPAAIRAAVLAGARSVPDAEVLEVGDRRAAIAEAVGRARPGDIVLIAGKGHETGQEIDGTVHPFDDRVVAAEEVARR